MTDDATVDAWGMRAEPREWECGPYCALCGQADELDAEWIDVVTGENP